MLNTRKIIYKKKKPLGRISNIYTPLEKFEWLHWPCSACSDQLITNSDYNNKKKGTKWNFYPKEFQQGKRKERKKEGKTYEKRNLGKSRNNATITLANLQYHSTDVPS